MIIKKHDVAIIGSGLAGVVAAIELAENNLDVAIIYDQKSIIVLVHMLKVALRL